MSWLQFCHISLYENASNDSCQLTGCPRDHPHHSEHLLFPLTHSPLWCSAREERGGQTLNIACFKGYNNIFFASPPTICWACYFTILFLVFLFSFFSWAHVFPNSGKITTSILSCPDCMKSLIALFICSAHKRLQNSWLDLKLLMTFCFNRKGERYCVIWWHLITLLPHQLWMGQLGLHGTRWTVVFTE